MKKSLIALAVLASSGAAMAQSSVTLFGVVDTGVTYVNGENNWSGLTSGNNSTSRLGFRGVEDLGGGLKAQFWLEAGINTDSGDGASGKESSNTNTGLEFKRRSTVSLLGSFGEVRLGRSLTAAYDAVSRYDVFGTVGVAQSRIWGQSQNQIRINNMLGFYSADFSGFKFAVNYGFGEQSGSTRDGSYVGGSATYDNGPLSLGLSAERHNSGSTQVTGANVTVDKTAYAIGGSYNFGVAKLLAAYRTQEVEAATGGKFDLDGYYVGLSAPVGAAGEVKVSYNRYESDVNDGKADQFGLGYVHSLSKRTAVYTSYAYIKNKNGLGVTLGNGGLKDGEKQHAVQVGVRHAF